MRQLDRLYAAIQRGQRFVAHDIWHIGLPGEDVPSGFIIKQIRVAILLVSNLLRSALMLRASALTFATILAIVPSLALLFYLIQTFELDEAIFQAAKHRVEHFVEDTAQFLRPEETPAEVPADRVVIAEPPTETVNVTTDGTQPPAPAATANPATVIDSARDDDQTLRALIRRALFPELEATDNQYVDPVQELFDLASSLADRAAGDPGALFVTGLILFFTTVLGLMRNIEKSFNHIWGVRRTRPWYRMIGDYMLITMLLPFVATAVLGVTAALQAQTVRDALGPLAVLVNLAQYVVIWLLFSALYFVVPNTRVKPGYALLGGFIAGSIWVLLSWAYVHFQFGFARYNLLYSTFAQIPMLLIWIYLSWSILLLGAEITFAYQNEKTFAMERFAEDASFAYREALALRAMLDVAQRFDAGDPGLSPGPAAKRLNVPTRLLNDIMEDLAKAGLVIAAATEPITYQPARALDKITLRDVTKAMRETGREPSLLREDELVQKLHSELERHPVAANKLTLAEMLERYAPKPPTPEKQTIPFKSQQSS